MMDFSIRRALLSLAVLCLAGAATARAEDAVRFSNEIAEPGGQVIVDVIVANDAVIAGLAIPFRWSSSDLHLDSIHFVPDRFRGDLLIRGDTSERTTQAGAILIVSKPPNRGGIERGNSAVASMHFTVASGALAQYVYVDTVLEEVGGVLLTFAQFSNFEGTKVIFPYIYPPGTITIGDPGGIASITAIPERLDFVAAKSIPSVLEQTVAIQSIGGPPFTWTVSKSASWLRLLPVSGETPGQCAASVDFSSLDPGTYEDTIVIVSAGAVNSPMRIPVTLRVEAGTMLTVVPDHLEFHMVEQGSEPDDQTINVVSSNGVLLPWNARGTARWLLMEVTAGSQPRDVAIAVDAAGLGAGQYADTLTFTATGASNSPLKIPVDLVIDSIPSPRPDSVTTLSQNRPNPFSTWDSPETRIVFHLATSGRVVVSIIDILGRRVRTLISEERPSGYNEVRWDGRDDDHRLVSSGHYFYRLTAGGHTVTRRMVLIK